MKKEDRTNLDAMLGAEKAKQDRMTPGERREYFDEIAREQRAAMKPYTPGPRQAQAFRPNQAGEVSHRVPSSPVAAWFDGARTALKVVESWRGGDSEAVAGLIAGEIEGAIQKRAEEFQMGWKQHQAAEEVETERHRPSAFPPLSREDVLRVHGNYDYGGRDPMEVINEAVFKIALGYAVGSTTQRILEAHDLAAFGKVWFLTVRGRHHLRSLFGKDPVRALMRASESTLKFEGDLPD